MRLAIAGKVAVMACVMAGCGGGPTSPTPPLLPLALTGQSQAVILAPYLQQDYAGPLIGAWESGLSIAFWGPEDRMWRQLAPFLHQRLAGLVWLQGESDCEGLSTAVHDYDVRFPETMARIRHEAADDHLLILIVSVSPTANCVGIRAIQAEWVATHDRAALISADEVPRLNFPADLHFTEAGAADLAKRVVAAVR